MSDISLDTIAQLGAAATVASALLGAVTAGFVTRRLRRERRAASQRLTVKVRSPESLNTWQFTIQNRSADKEFILREVHRIDAEEARRAKDTQNSSGNELS